MLLVPEQIRPQRVRVDWSGPQVCQGSVDGIEVALFKFLQIVYKVLNGDFADRRRC
jgi:hypothetical protein